MSLNGHVDREYTVTIAWGLLLALGSITISEASELELPWTLFASTWPSPGSPEGVLVEGLPR